MAGQTFDYDWHFKIYFLRKELSPCHKFGFFNPYIFWTLCRKPLIFQTYMIWSNKSHSLKCQMSTTLDCEDIGIRKSEFVTKTQFLYTIFYSRNLEKNIEIENLFWQKWEYLLSFFVFQFKPFLWWGIPHSGVLFWYVSFYFLNNESFFKLNVPRNC